jgi:hypothetical protein
VTVGQQSVKRKGRKETQETAQLSVRATCVRRGKKLVGSWPQANDGMKPHNIHWFALHVPHPSGHGPIRTRQRRRQVVERTKKRMSRISCVAEGLPAPPCGIPVLAGEIKNAVRCEQAAMGVAVAGRNPPSAWGRWGTLPPGHAHISTSRPHHGARRWWAGSRPGGRTPAAQTPRTPV